MFKQILNLIVGRLRFQIDRMMGRGTWFTWANEVFRVEDLPRR